MTAPLPNRILQDPAGGLPQNIQDRNTRWLLIIVGLASLAFAAAFIVLGISSGTSQPLLLAAMLVITFIAAFICRDARIIESRITRVFSVLVCLELTLIAYAVIFENAILPAVLACVTMGLLFGVVSLEEGRAANAVMLGVVAAIVVAAAGVYRPWEPLSGIGLVGHFGYLITVVTMLVFGYLRAKETVQLSIGMRLVVIGILLVAIPVGVLAAINNASFKNIKQQEANIALEDAAGRFAQQLDEFILSNRASINTQANMPALGEYLSIAPAKRAGTTQEAMVNSALKSFEAALKVKERTFLKSFALLDAGGQVAYTSNPADVGWKEQKTQYFIKTFALGQAFASDVMFSPVDNAPYIFFSAPVRDATNIVVGVLRVKYSASILQSMAKESTGSQTEANYPIVFDKYYMRLAQPYRPQLLYQVLVPLRQDQLQKMSTEGGKPEVLRSTNMNEMAAFLDNAEESPYYTGWSESDRTDQMAAVKMSSKDWYVVFVQSAGVLQAQLEQQTSLAVLIATILAGLVSMAVMRLGRSFSDPILALTGFAREVMGGNLDAKPIEKGLQEFLLLGQTFSMMANQVKQMIAGLEDRVRERTSELAKQNDALVLRARQFQTVADVARGVAETQELQDLLDNVTVMISDRFGFAHTGIFLIDDAREFAVLRAASSEGGARMLARQHRLRVGQAGIVGYVTTAGEPRVATDVGQDAVFFNNPDLPLTRSEMALPLKVGTQIIGALDVQSNQSDAFSDEDIQLFSILADQIAIAIYNNQLYAEMSQTLAESQAVHRRYLQAEWNREMENGQYAAYRYTHSAILPSSPVVADDVNSAVELGEPVATIEAGLRVLAMPVKLRGETIAVIRVTENSEGSHDWHTEEVETVKDVADQVALALENARLFTQTARRAERERKVLEITSKIRQHNDPQEMLRVAVEELQNALKASRAQVLLQPAPAGHGGNGNGNGNGNGHNGAA